MYLIYILNNAMYSVYLLFLSKYFLICQLIDYKIIIKIENYAYARWLFKSANLCSAIRTFLLALWVVAVNKTKQKMEKQAGSIFGNGCCIFISL